jgi:hypothetical protein
MSTDYPSAQGSKAMIWTGRVLSGLFGLFMLMDGVMKLIVPPPAVVREGTLKIGFPEAAILPLGIIVTVSTILYLIPRTSVLGAILLTGYLGGAVATHVRMGDGWFNILLPALFGAIAWLGLVLRDARLRSLLPMRM